MSFEVGKTYRMKGGQEVEVCVILPADKWIRNPGHCIGFRMFATSPDEGEVPLMGWCDAEGRMSHPDGDMFDLVAE